MESPICSIVPKGTVFKWDREPSGRTGTMNADQLLTDLGPGSTVGNKGRKRGQIWSNRTKRWPGEGKRASATLSRLHTTSGLASFADIFFRPRRFFSPSFPNAKTGPRLITSQCRDAPLTSSKTKTQAY